MPRSDTLSSPKSTTHATTAPVSWPIPIVTLRMVKESSLVETPIIRSAADGARIAGL